MPLYISLERKRTNAYYDRLHTAINLFNDLFGFLNLEGQVSPFEIDPFLETNETIPLSLSLERLKGRLEKSSNKNAFGIEIASKLKFKNGYVPVVFTLLPYNRSTHYDILLEIVPNATITKFADIEDHITGFRTTLINNIVRYNKGLEGSKTSNGLAKINKSFISIDESSIHNINDYQMFYSRDPNDLVNELFFFTSNEVRERLTLANRDKLATTLIENIYSFGAINKIATTNNIEIRGGSIIILPKDTTSMQTFVKKAGQLIEKYVMEVYHEKEFYDKKILEVFSDV